MSKETKLNASQRLETLEYQNGEIQTILNNMARDLALIKEAIKLLGNKLDVVAKVTNVTDEQISAGMIANNVDELKQKVDGFIANGVLVVTDVVTDTCFIVGKEVNEKGEVVNPRIQLAVGASAENVKAALIGAKVGDTVVFSEDTLRLEVNEIYNIVAPGAPAASDESSTEVEA